MCLLNFNFYVCFLGEYLVVCLKLKYCLFKKCYVGFIECNICDVFSLELERVIQENECVVVIVGLMFLIGDEVLEKGSEIFFVDDGFVLVFFVGVFGLQVILVVEKVVCI